MQYRERQPLWCTKCQSWIQEWHNVIFSDKSWFCMQYFDGCIHVCSLQGDCTLPVYIWYYHRSTAPGVMVTTRNTTSTSLILINDNLNTDWDISDILCHVVVLYLRGLSNVTFQQDNARPHVARHVLIFLNTQGIRLLPWPAQSPDLLQIENIWSWVAERLAHHRSPINTVDNVNIDLKKHGVSCLFLSSNPSLTPCLTGYGPF